MQLKTSANSATVDYCSSSNRWDLYLRQNDYEGEKGYNFMYYTLPGPRSLNRHKSFMQLVCDYILWKKRLPELY